MTLGELIDFLEPQNPVLVLPEGFATPHSYRGYYDELAFEPAQNVTVGAMLDSARSAVGATYGGWKGGDFTMDLYTTVHLAVEGCTGEGIGPVVLRLMLAAGREAAVTAATPAQPAPGNDLADGAFRCPACGSRQPSMHPAVSGGGEVTRLCGHPFHGDGGHSGPQPAPVSPHLECAVCASGVTTPHGAAGTPLSDYLRERGRPGVADMIEDAERAAQLPPVQQPLDFVSAWREEAREIDEDPAADDRYDSGEIAALKRCADQLAAAIAAQEPHAAPGNAEVAYEQWIEHRNPENVGSMAGFTAGWQEALIAVSGWPRCPNGCGCRLGTEDADSRDCACDGLCCYNEIEVSELFAERDRLRAVITDILAAFGPSGSGHTARVGQVQIAKWRTRAGLTS